MLCTNGLHVDGVRFPHRERDLIPHVEVVESSIFDVNAGARSINIVLRTITNSLMFDEIIFPRQGSDMFTDMSSGLVWAHVFPSSDCYGGPSVKHHMAICKLGRVEFHDGAKGDFFFVGWLHTTSCSEFGGDMMYTNHLHVDGVRFPHRDGVLNPYVRVVETSIFDVNAGAGNVNVVLWAGADSLMFDEVPFPRHGSDMFADLTSGATFWLEAGNKARGAVCVQRAINDYLEFHGVWG